MKAFEMHEGGFGHMTYLHLKQIHLRTENEYKVFENKQGQIVESPNAVFTFDFETRMNANDLDCLLVFQSELTGKSTAIAIAQHKGNTLSYPLMDFESSEMLKIEVKP